jgi:hypothetical protein
MGGGLATIGWEHGVLCCDVGWGGVGWGVMWCDVMWGGVGWCGDDAALGGDGVLRVVCCAVVCAVLCSAMLCCASCSYDERLSRELCTGEHICGKF